MKNRYGSGYLIELKLKSLASESSDRLAEQKANADRIRRINSLFPSAVVQESFEDRVIFSVAQESIISLAHTFESLEKGSSHWFHSSENQKNTKRIASNYSESMRVILSRLSDISTNFLYIIAWFCSYSEGYYQEEKNWVFFWNMKERPKSMILG